ncbi:MAG: polyprenol phosphomannose-dependent alpha 1,6 mannosyltransferase MptB [Flavobacteriaceae bacterium]|nr:polyprenol phosphomannose-dependent alpha 1,6 mannosyltransferase MptB [Flavobacteriaceae bacterium]
MIGGRSFKKVLQVAPILLSVLGYYFMGFEVDRAQSLILIPLYLSLFFCSYPLIFKSYSLKQILGIGILFRLIFLLSTPLLSQDFFRFLWDGMLLSNGLNPYEATPDLLNQTAPLFSTPFSQELYKGMGALSAEHYSNYPPINQLGFYLASLIGGNSILANIISIRVLLILSDLGIFWFGIKLLDYLNRSKKRIGLYFLNPLIIVELTGNLHWEGLMVFFFIFGLYLIFVKNQWKWATIPMAISVASKLIPLLILPLFWRFLKPKKSMLFGLLILLCLFLFFVPFFLGADNLSHYLNTIGLWFNRFEFNGSIYYVIRAIGYEVKGYNIIRKLGTVSPYIILGIVAVFTFIRNNKTPHVLLTGMLFCLSCYFFIATTVHPWYIVSLVSLAIFTNYSYPLIWSALVVLSYATYGNPDFNENYYLIGLQYGIVYGVFLLELIQRKNLLHHFK